MTTTGAGRRLARLVGVLLLGLAATGCGGGLSKGNYEKIKQGMALKEVEDLLGGKGTEVAPAELLKLPGMEDLKQSDKDEKPPPTPGVPPMNLSAYTWIKWGDDQKFVVVAFQDGKEITKRQHGL
jgi:hypothetical protein